MKSKNKISFLNLFKLHEPLREKFNNFFNEFLDNNQLILGKYTQEFEKEYAVYSDSKYCLGVGNGLDALTLLLSASGVGRGDDIIVPGHTFIATWLSVTKLGANIIPVEPEEDSFNIDVNKLENAITKDTKAIVVVHLYGMPADLDEILRVAKKYNIPVFEDAAQAHGAKYKNKKIGSHSDGAAWSFYPGKNLGALGDGGGITTNNKSLYEKIKLLRNYGSTKKYEHTLIGENSRLDPFQAGILSIKLNHLDSWNKRRMEIADIYNSQLCNLDLSIPGTKTDRTSSWHLYCIETNERERLQQNLQKNMIETGIHYPKPPHLQEAYKGAFSAKLKLPITERKSKALLSLPICPTLTDTEVEHIIDTIKKTSRK